MPRVRAVPLVPPIIVDHKTGNSYEKKDFLGRGVFGYCFKVKNQNTNEFFAMKSMPISNHPTKKSRGNVARETDIQMSFDHPNLLKCCDFFENGLNYYIILKMCEHGDLWDLVQRRGELTEPECFYFGRHILNGLKYMHERKILHLDLKPDNIFVGDNMIAKIGDFGKSIRYETNMTFEQTSTPKANSFTAPENLQTKNYSEKTDIWSFGCIFYFLRVGKCPFDKKSYNTLAECIESNSYDLPDTMTPAYKQVVQQFLISDPQARPNASLECFQQLNALYPESLIPYSGLPISCLARRPDMPIFNNPLNQMGLLSPIKTPLTEPKDKGTYLPEIWRQIDNMLLDIIDVDFRDTTPAEDPEIWIKDWHLLKDSRCLVYALSDHSFGIFDNCYGCMVMNLRKTKVCVHEEKGPRVYLKGERMPEMVKRSVEYSVRIRNRHPVRGKRGTKEKEDIERTPFVKQCNFNEEKTLFAFHMSNKTVQMVMNDDAMLFSPEKQTVTFIHKDGKWDSYRTNGPLLKKLKYLTLLQHAKKMALYEIKSLDL